MIQSMTAYSRQAAQGDWGMATWEIRAVNQRYFDCTIKMPEMFRYLESQIRLSLQQQLKRGRIECNLRFQVGETTSADFVVNTGLLKKLTVAIESVKNYLPAVAPIDPIKIMSWPQVVQVAEADIAPAQQHILQLFEKTLADMVAARDREGAALQTILEQKLKAVATLAGSVKQKIPAIIEQQRNKLLVRLAEIKGELDTSRLEQEMVFFAQKIDVTEELDRLELHVEETRRVLKAGNDAGKRLDFLMQELNREANTLAAKAADITVTQTAVDLKVLIEQMREQVQNIV